MGHALARTAMQFGVARFALGIGESPNFPAALKTVTVWFPKRERALANGIFNSGSNIGALIAPLVVPWLAVKWGWQSAFLLTGAIGFIWIVLWWLVYRDPAQHSLLSAEERKLIDSGREEADKAPSVPYREILKSRLCWAFLLGKFLTDHVWWFYLFWLPGFLNRTYHLNISSLGLPLVVIYQASTIGSVGGGWLSSTLLRKGRSVNFARKTAMLVCAAAVTSVIFIPQVGGNLWAAVALVSVGAAAHQGWSANIYCLPSDSLPESSVASALGFGGTGGAIGGMLVSPVIGYWLDYSHGAYGPLFVVAGGMYLLALLVIHLMVPRLGAERA